MPTRQFAFLLVIAVMIAVGVGLVVGSRRAPDELRHAANPVASQPAAAAHEEVVGGPATHSVGAAKSSSEKSADAVVSGAQPNAATKRATAANSAMAPKSQADSNKVNGAHSSAKIPGASKAGAAEPVQATSPDSARRADIALPRVTPSLPEKITASTGGDSEFVFVSRSSLMKGKLAANEAAAIATLRSISSAQAQLQSAGVVDTDADGFGEYGYFGELSGTSLCRVPPGEAGFKCEPAVLSAAFGKLTPAGNVQRSGYCFRMYLPGPTVNKKIAGIAESSGSSGATNGTKTDHDNCEIYYTCYAWPAEPGVTGNRAFFFNQEGDMLFLANSKGVYAGDDHAPAFDAALSAPRSGDMAAPYVEGAKSNDGQAWMPYAGPEPRVVAFVELGPATQADAEKGNAPDSEKVVVPRAAIRRAEMAENESAAISTLSVLWMAEETVKLSGAIDTDNDGVGEYGFFGELAGTSPCRAAPGGKRTLLRPAVLSPTMGRISNAGNLVKDGYVYRLYLPGANSDGKVPALPEAPGGGCVTTGPRPNADNAEARWAVYAWPLEAGKTGQRAFFTDSEAEYMVLENAEGFYSGEERAPAFDAALDAKQPADMKSPAANSMKSVDGHPWMPM